MTQRQADALVGFVFTFWGVSGFYFAFYGPRWAADVSFWVGIPLIAFYFIGGAIYRSKASKDRS